LTELGPIARHARKPLEPVPASLGEAKQLLDELRGYGVNVTCFRPAGNHLCSSTAMCKLYWTCWPILNSPSFGTCRLLMRGKWFAYLVRCSKGKNQLVVSRIEGYQDRLDRSPFDSTRQCELAIRRLEG
jgi:hypothetical protein